MCTRIGYALPPDRINEIRVEIKRLPAGSNSFIVPAGSKQKHGPIVVSYRRNRVQNQCFPGLLESFIVPAYMGKNAAYHKRVKRRLGFNRRAPYRSS